MIPTSYVNWLMKDLSIQKIKGRDLNPCLLFFISIRKKDEAKLSAPTYLYQGDSYKLIAIHNRVEGL